MSFAGMLGLAEKQATVWRRPIVGPKVEVIAAIARHCSAGSEHRPVALPALDPIGRTLRYCDDSRTVADVMELLVAANPQRYVQTLRTLTAPIRNNEAGEGCDPRGLVGTVLGYFSSAAWLFTSDFPPGPERFDNSVHCLTPELLASGPLQYIGGFERQQVEGWFAEPIKQFAEGPPAGPAQAGHIMNLMEALRQLSEKRDEGWKPTSLVSVILDQLTFRTLALISPETRLRAIGEIAARTTSTLVEAVGEAARRNGAT